MSLERVLLVHNAYQQAGGEDSVVADELALLRRKGHEVIEFRRDNQAIHGMGRLGLAGQTLWSRGSHASALAELRKHRPAVVHVHNTFPLISPSLYWACAEAGVPVVQTLHNFRLACPQAMFLHQGKVCERCLGESPWPAIQRGCYRDSRAQTAVLVGMLTLHRALKTFEKKVARFIALNEFCRSKFIQAGLPAERIVVKPNFSEVGRPEVHREREGLLYVGRLSQEKGMDVLARAWADCHGLNLRVIGSGGDGAALAGQPGLELLGSQSAEQVQAEMARASALVLPSICFENFPRTLVEAYAAGLPVIASRIGSLAELVEHGKTGLLFEPGNATDLARCLRWAAEHPSQMAAMGANARQCYEANYTPEINYEQLLDIYRTAIREPRKGP